MMVYTNFLFLWCRGNILPSKGTLFSFGFVFFSNLNLMTSALTIRPQLQLASWLLPAFSVDLKQSLFKKKTNLFSLRGHFIYYSVIFVTFDA